MPGGPDPARAGAWSATREVRQHPGEVARSVALGRHPGERVRRRAPRDRIPVGRVGRAEAELGHQPGDALVPGAEWVGELLHLDADPLAETIGAAGHLRTSL